MLHSDFTLLGIYYSRYIIILQDIYYYLKAKKVLGKNLIIKSLLVTAIQALNFLILFIKTLNTIT